MKFDEYESELINLDEKELIEKRSPTPEEIQHFKNTAKNTLNKDKRINIRISTRDLSSLQKRANRYGLPYQTFIASILHQYISGDLKEAIKPFDASERRLPIKR